VDELLAKCDRILDFEDGDARSFTVLFAEEVKLVVLPLRKRLRNALAAWDIARDAVISDAECTRRGGYETISDKLFDAIGAVLAGEEKP